MIQSVKTISSKTFVTMMLVNFKPLVLVGLVFTVKNDPF